MEHQLHSGTAKLTLVEGGRHTEINYGKANSKATAKVFARLPSILQTTLMLEELLALFQEQTQPILAFDSFHFLHQGVYQVDSDTAHHHRCHYKLEMNGTYLGDLTLTRRHKFSDSDIKLLEDLLCLLVYPIRNCLLYRQALSSALKDNLTGLGNRSAYEANLTREIDIARRHQTPLSLLVMDIDNFKNINDSYGHNSGDRALKVVAGTVVQALRLSDACYRFGGEEFTILLGNTDIKAARLVAERIRIAVSQILCNDGKQNFSFTASLGIAQLHQREQGYHLFERADMALYQAKQTGRNLTVCAPSPAQV
ncbi:GGDEF domain protein [Methylophaga thiooxydans]|uniref:diguanylate cyclase n=1 Tax=Methylophaga thiooxydans TaxID=392484 RepID=A0A0A0BK44_9GAMM|nr:GGDEF domain-containing protein [Methylophaga thiooxydans]KGM08047.1 GGDEF domain protein [Methylophaga thiooxydans]